MNYVREGDVLHVHSIDRLCRNTADLLATVEQLTERGVSVHFHKETLRQGKNSPAEYDAHSACSSGTNGT